MQTLNDVALGYHELYLSLLNAGFIEGHALYLVGQVWSSNILAAAKSD